MVVSHSNRVGDFQEAEPFVHLKESIKKEPKLIEQKSHEEKLSSSTPLEQQTSELVFEKEISIPDFEREPVYDVDNFEKNSKKVEKLLTPPPDFQEALKKLPQSIQNEFKHVLNADIVGIWPIKNNILLNTNIK